MSSIDMIIVAQSITHGPATPVGHPVEITKDIRLHRFDEDQLHILVDGSGGYKAIRYPHTPYESVLREGCLSEFENAGSGGVDVEDPEVFVTLPGSPTDWTVWRISQNLTDRWGDLNYYNSHEKPLEPLEKDESLFKRLLDQMWDELTFIVRKDGQYGVLFECEFISRESEASMGDGNEYDQLRPHTEMIAILDAGIREKLIPSFPGVEFAIPDEDHIVNGRPAIWAFVKDGLLDAQDRERLGSLLLQI